MTNALIVRNKIVFLLIGEKKRGKKSSSLTGDQKKSSGSLKTWPKSNKEIGYLTGYLGELCL